MTTFGRSDGSRSTTAHSRLTAVLSGLVCLSVQNLVSVAVVLLLARLRLIQVEPLSWQLIRVWAPINLIFVGMLITSFFSLRYMQVAMVTILKNITNLITAVGEMYLFKKRQSARVWGSLFLMIVSAFCGGITDLAFHPTGYMWQGANCLFTAAYSVTLALHFLLSSPNAFTNRDNVYSSDESLFLLAVVMTPCHKSSRPRNHLLIEITFIVSFGCFQKKKSFHKSIHLI